MTLHLLAVLLTAGLQLLVLVTIVFHRRQPHYPPYWTAAWLWMCGAQMLGLFLRLWHVSEVVGLSWVAWPEENLLLSLISACLLVSLWHFAQLVPIHMETAPPAATTPPDTTP